MVNFAFDASGADEEVPLRHAQFTAPFNQTGQPAVSVQHSFDERGLPIGVQIVGQRFNDLGVLKMAYFVEQSRSKAVAWPLEPLF
jgi:Asp-tRNA(Asn)/Glu-tRNA(Gln) amidotransferase A subunit family amidase